MIGLYYNCIFSTEPDILDSSWEGTPQDRTRGTRTLSLKGIEPDELYRSGTLGQELRSSLHG